MDFHDDCVVVAPHPDDEVLGCGGTVLRHLDAGARVHVVYVTSGNSGDVKLAQSEQFTQELRRREADRVIAALGPWASASFLERDDGFVCADADLVADLVRILRRAQAPTVYTSARDDTHPDHSAVFAAVERAFRLAGSRHHPALGERARMKSLMEYEVWSPLPRPDLYVDISGVVDDKERLLRNYVSQLNILDYVTAIQGLNSYRGASGPKVPAAEAFRESKP